MSASCSLICVLMVSVRMVMGCLDVTVNQDSSQMLPVEIVQVQLLFYVYNNMKCLDSQETSDHEDQGPVVQSVVSFMSSLRVISLTVLVHLIYSILIFFSEKM